MSAEKETRRFLKRYPKAPRFAVYELLDWLLVAIARKLILDETRQGISRGHSSPSPHRPSGPPPPTAVATEDQGLQTSIYHPS